MTPKEVDDLMELVEALVRDLNSDHIEDKLAFYRTLDKFKEKHCSPEVVPDVA